MQQENSVEVAEKGQHLAKLLDPLAIDLILKMLILNPVDRISAKQALNHEYFRSEPLPCEPHEIPIIEGEWRELEFREDRF